MRHTPPHAWRQGDTPLPQRAPPAARPAGASGRPRPGASCGLGSHDRPEPRATIWPGAPAGQSARPGPGPAPARPWPPAASPFASPPAPLPAPGQARPAPAQPPARPWVSLTPRSRRGSAVAGWAPCCARCRRLPWRGRCAGRRQRRAGGARGSQPGFQAGQLEPGATTGEAVKGKVREGDGRALPAGPAGEWGRGAQVSAAAPPARRFL